MSEPFKINRDPEVMREIRAHVRDSGLVDPAKLDGMPDEELADQLEHTFEGMAEFGRKLGALMDRAVVEAAEEITKGAAK